MNNLSIDVNKYYLPFAVIFLFTLFNAFFNSMAVAYGYSGYTVTSFLFSASDLHADLIKLAMSYIDDGSNLDITKWTDLYRNFFLHNPYGGINNLNNGSLSNLGSTPLYLNISLIVKYLIVQFSPQTAVVIFYVTVMISTVLLSFFFFRNTKDTLIVASFMMLSYPMLFILTRGHVFSFLTAILLMVFISLIVNKDKRIFLIILTLAIAVSFRPNVIVLGFLLFVFGFKNGLKYISTLTIVSMMIFFINYSIGHYNYPDYTLSHFFEATNIYFKNYVIGGAGNEFNNSLFGGIKMLASINGIGLSFNFLKNLNLMIAISMIGLLVTSGYLFFKNILDRFEFSFIALAIYALSSSVFATYHLFTFYVFLLILLKFSKENYLSQKNISIIMFVVVFLLIPKNYYHFGTASIETLLNPLVLLVGTLLIVVRAFIQNKADSVTAIFRT